MNRLLFGMLLVGSMLFVGCNKDTTNDTAISFAGDTGFTATDATVTAGGAFTVKWTATSSTNMGYFSILKDGSAYDVWSQKEIPNASKSTYIDQVTITVPLTTGTYTYAFVVFDNSKVELARKSIVITVAAAGTINSYTDKIIGGSGNATIGSSFASADGTIYLLAAAKTNSSKIDFIYFYGDVNLATLAAPSDVDVATVFTGTNGISTWSVKNATKIQKVSIDFTSITTPAGIPDVSSTGASKVNNLAIGDVLAFQTASTSSNANKKGLIKVTAITTGSNDSGSITIQVKVAQ